MILDEAAALQASRRRLDNLRQNEFSGDNVSEGIGGGLKLELLRERPVKERETVDIYDKQVDGARSPGSVRIPENPLDFQGGLIAFGLEAPDEVSYRPVHESLQGCAVHHVTGRDSRHIVRGGDFRHQVGFLEIEAGDQDGRAAVGVTGSPNGVAGGVAASAMNGPPSGDELAAWVICSTMSGLSSPPDSATFFPCKSTLPVRVMVTK